MFLLAVTFYGEVPGADKMVTFAFIWVALAIFVMDAIYTQRRVRRSWGLPDGASLIRPTKAHHRRPDKSPPLQPVLALKVQIRRQTGEHHKDNRPG